MSSNKGWLKIKIKDFAEVVSGGTPKTSNNEYWDGNISWITPKDLSNHNERYISRGLRSITDTGLGKSSAKLLPKNTILFSSRAPIGYVAIAKKEVTTNQGFKNIVCNDKIAYFEFVYYLMKYKTSELESLANGSTFKEVSGKVVKDFEVMLPPLEEQKAIAKMLSDLDAKIEVNNQISQRLEEVAQALFKHWFVDFEFPNEDGEPYKSSGGEMIESELGMIPKGWEVGTLSQIANVLMGQSPKGSSYNEEKQGEIFYQGRTDFNFRFPSIRLYTTEPKRMAEAGDVLMSVRAPVGDINIAKQRCCIGRGLAAIRSNSNHQSFVLYTMNNLQKALSIYNGEGTIFGSINKDTLNNLKVLIPDNTIIDSFEWTVKKSDEMIRNLAEQTDILKQTRDTLLPKLMSGELRVTNIQD